MHTLLTGLGWVLALAGGAGLVFVGLGLTQLSRADPERRQALLGFGIFALVALGSIAGGVTLARRPPPPPDAPPELATDVPAARCPDLPPGAEPRHGEPARSPDELRLVHALHATAPTDRAWSLHAEDGLLLAHWNLADARWRDLALARGVQRTFQTRLRFVPEGRVVRVQDRSFELRWEAGVPLLSPVALAAGEASYFEGVRHERSYQVEYRVEDLGVFLRELLRGEWKPPRPVYAYDFSSEELHAPLRETVEACGWRWEPVAFGAL